MSGNLIYDTASERPRACISVRKGFNNYFVLTEFCNTDVVAIKINVYENGEMKSIVVCSAYFDANQDIPATLLELVIHCSRQSIELILLTIFCLLIQTHIILFGEINL